ncbi:uncharacterized protein LOC129598428 [Paramacrobiotus metropolitanus]|uniref:uncharacterized protein LOC129598428 n=1 Tax=Paramacrobiotus metropolitanus TaxID=2943436 RepID=UPI002445EACC|nr:uncharacterized protein LOC129598428 [Paramacrobiotus metropolitanus]
MNTENFELKPPAENATVITIVPVENAQGLVPSTSAGEAETSYSTDSESDNESHGLLAEHSGLEGVVVHSPGSQDSPETEGQTLRRRHRPAESDRSDRSDSSFQVTVMKTSAAEFIVSCDLLEENHFCDDLDETALALVKRSALVLVEIICTNALRLWYYINIFIRNAKIACIALIERLLRLTIHDLFRYTTEFVLDAYDQIGHYFLGFPDPYFASTPFRQWFRLIVGFGTFTFTLPILDVGSDILFIRNLWSDTNCYMNPQLLMLITLVPFFPLIFSFVTEIFSVHVDWAEASAENWRLAQGQLIKLPDPHLLSKRIVNDGSWSGLLQESQSETFKNRVKENVFPFEFFVRCWLFFQTWRNGAHNGKDSRYKEENDLEFHDMHLQGAQLKEIRYESSIQLIILLILMGTGTQPFSYTGCASVVMSLLSVAKYFPSSAQLPERFAFSRSLLMERDCIGFMEANQLLPPSLVLLYGTLSNFLYIVCRYHVIISLAVYNWQAGLMLIALQTVIVTASLILSYLLLPSDSFRMRRIKGSWIAKYKQRYPWRRKIGNVVAFVGCSLNILFYFLIAPVTTTVTMWGCVLGTALQAVALVAYFFVVHFEWRNNIYCREEVPRIGQFLQSAPVFHRLLITNILLSCVLLPSCTYALNVAARNAENWWILHRQTCTQCKGFKDRFCSHQPCWLCDWIWSNENDNLENFQIIKPVPFLLNYKAPSATSIIILQVLALTDDVERGRKGDMLLCHDHYSQLVMIRLWYQNAERVAQDRIDLDRDRVLWDISGDRSLQLFLIRVRTWGRQCTTDLLEHLYTPEGVPLQLWFKARLYDQMNESEWIKERDCLDIYWLKAKEIRQNHRSCGRECALRQRFLAGRLTINLEPSKSITSNLQDKVFTLYNNCSYCRNFAKYFFLIDEKRDGFGKCWSARPCPGIE